MLPYLTFPKENFKLPGLGLMGNFIPWTLKDPVVLVMTEWIGTSTANAFSVFLDYILSGSGIAFPIVILAVHI